MRRVHLFLAVLVLLLMACGASGGGAGDLPAALEPVPTLAEVVSPRVEGTPESGLPPTWTPEPAGSSGHLFGSNDGGGGSVEVPVTGTRFIHVVQRGETLGIIAERYGVSVSDLATINDIENINVIEVGQELIVPGTGDGN